MQQKPAPFLNLIVKYLHLAERFFLALFVISIILTLLGMKAEGLTQLAVAALAVVFFLYAYKPLEIPSDENEKAGFDKLLVTTIVPKVLWISAAISSIAIFFFLNGSALTAFHNQALMGMITTTVCLLFLLYGALKGIKHLNVITPILLRSIPLLFIDAFLYFLIS